MGPMKLLSRGENSLMSIPIDLIIDIFLRLPAKSIARCRCVSKHWASFIRRQDFRELFLTRSLSQLLFACQIKNKLYFFSAHQPQNPDQEKNSCVIVEANHLARFHCDSHSESEVFAPVSGFSCLFLRDERIVNINVCRKSLWAICNPSTGEYFPLPKGITKRKIGVRSYIGYDHIKKQFKVLSMTWSLKRRARSEEHQVMTLGTDQPSWKMVECCIPHVPGEDNGICINGVLYYKAKDYNSSEESMIVCFDVSSEKFRVLKVEEPFSGDMFHKPTLIIYNGKLGLLLQDTPFYLCGRSRSFELYVLEDEGKQEWSKHVHVLPTSWEKVVGKAELYFVGMNGTNEIVLSPHSLSMPCHIFYYNTERKTITRVVIQGLAAFNGCGFRTFLNYADNMMLIQGM